MTAERIGHSGAIVITALVSWEGVRWYESATYYGHTIREAKQSFKESCERLKYRIEG